MNAPPATPNGVSLRLLEIFGLIAEAGTMSAAAARLGLSRAAVSQAVSTLEQAYATPLIDRSVRPPVFTLAGNTVLTYAREITAKLRELDDAMRYGRSGRVPLLRIGMLNSFASTAGPFVLDQLRDVADEWTVASSHRATSFRALLERESDVVITSDETAVPEAVEARAVFSEPFALATPLKWRGKAGDLAALTARLDFIRYGHASHMRSAVDGYLARHGIQPLQRYRFDTTDAALRMVAGGFGWTIVTPLILLKSTDVAKAVRIVALRSSPLTRTLRVAMRRGEGRAIAERVRVASIATVRDVIAPQVAAAFPALRRELRLLDAG